MPPSSVTLYISAETKCQGLFWPKQHINHVLHINPSVLTIKLRTEVLTFSIITLGSPTSVQGILTQELAPEECLWGTVVCTI